MRDYEELVKALRENAELAEGNIWEVPIMLPDNLKQAADAIEELCRENESLANSVNEAAEILRNRSPKWISVEERCPEKDGDYLVVDDCKNLYVNEWHCLLKKWQYDDSRITHWMPLPEPPKEDDDA